MEILRLSADDAELARTTLREVKGANTCAERVAEWLARDAHVLVAALDGGGPLGFCLGYVLDRADAGCRCATAGVKRTSRAPGAERMWVVTGTENAAARALYASTGAEVGGSASILFSWREPFDQK